MILTIVRRWKTPKSTCGELQIDGALFCYTLELPAPIPAASYQARVEISPKLSNLERCTIYTPRLYGVPGFPNDDVLIHFGNYPSDTEGCILVGMTHATDFIGESMEAFQGMMAKLGDSPLPFSVDITESF